MTSLFALFIGLVLGLLLGVLIFGRRKKVSEKAHLEFDVHTNLQTTFIGVKGMILTNEEKVAFGIRAVTASGKPARFDGVPVWVSSDPAVVALEVAEGGMSAMVVAKVVGTAQVTVRVDADLDVDEVRELFGTVDVEVVEAEAVAFEVTTGTPELQ